MHRALDKGASAAMAPGATLSMMRCRGWICIKIRRPRRLQDEVLPLFSYMTAMNTTLREIMTPRPVTIELDDKLALATARRCVPGISAQWGVPRAR